VTSAGAGISSNVAAALSYLLLFISGLLFLMLEPYRNDRFVRFHAMQSIFLTAAWFVFFIVWQIILEIVSFAGFLFMFFSGIGSLIHLGFLVFLIFLMYKAYKKEIFVIPIIGEIAQKQVDN
jgi:uncharacterized membrane protein